MSAPGALRFLVDLVVFAAWDRARDLRPVSVKCAMRFEQWPLLMLMPCPICRDAMRAAYFRTALKGASPRAWRYLEARRPDIVFLWRFGAPPHPVAENA
jgi:hypothetical protein